MSAGTPITTVRLHPRLLEACRAYLETRKTRSTCVPYTMTDLVEAALCDFLDHVRRSRKKPKPPLAQTTIEQHIDAVQNEMQIELVDLSEIRDTLGDNYKE